MARRYFSKAVESHIILKGYLRDSILVRMDRRINLLRSMPVPPLDVTEAVERVHFAVKNNTPVSWVFITKAFPDLKKEDFEPGADPGFEHIQ
mmetsp:Transcript_18188/g.32601  ORF Transcript_18188/g.32601 Transcript_18188/m.32601 type:complete len:92 (-) Transcript_18188:1008-1283(-)